MATSTRELAFDMGPPVMLGFLVLCIFTAIGFMCADVIDLKGRKHSLMVLLWFIMGAIIVFKLFGE